MSKVIITREQWKDSPEALQSNVEFYRQQLEAHKLTVGVPAPFISDPVVDYLARNPQLEFELEAVPEPPPKPDTPPLTLQFLYEELEALKARVAALERNGGDRLEPV